MSAALLNKTRMILIKYGLILPIILYLLFFFIYPLGKMLVSSFLNPSFTLTNYVRIFTQPLYLKVILYTFRLSLIVTLFSLLMGYPLAYLLNKIEIKSSRILMIFIVVPFWTSILVRIYAWMVILGRHGVINSLLLKLGIISTPLDLLFNTFSVTVGMVHYLLPFMVFSLYSVMAGIDKTIIKAAYNLGATPFRTFIRVFFPLSLPGVGAGSLIVFILAIGFFITPALLGGRKDMVISVLIERQINITLNWSFAAAIAFVLLVFTLTIFYFSNFFLGISKIWGEKV
jgi:putative spermidine/putrescine transport system permease protein